MDASGSADCPGAGLLAGLEVAEGAGSPREGVGENWGPASVVCAGKSAFPCGSVDAGLFCSLLCDCCLAQAMAAVGGHYVLVEGRKMRSPLGASE